ncbi:MAG: anthranilate synthase component I family protein [Bacteroidales bacterium]|nr:MAG: anthranilate synthase component I family protein [Bacteroidales bacterium]
MKTITLKTKSLKMPADTYTPVSIYLRLRDAFPQCLLLECSDYSSRNEAYSYICLKPIGGIIVNSSNYEVYSPLQSKTSSQFEKNTNVVDLVDDFFSNFKVEGNLCNETLPGFFGFSTYDAINLFDNVAIQTEDSEIPLLRYDFYQVVISFNHFNNTLTLCEFLSDTAVSESDKITSLLANRNSTSFPFKTIGPEQSNMTDDKYKEMIEQGKKHCARGDVFQIVLSRKFSREFTGDEFNVYRALRSINPSPYLFYFDYLGYKLFGSSPEAQLKVEDGKAKINPIAGSAPRTGDNNVDKKAIEDLLANPKENSEHCMLVDLARNDLSRFSSEVEVETYREVHSYSHIIHLVSTVVGQIDSNIGLCKLFGATFPAGTLSGAPKHRAVQLINEIEPTSRGYYGGAIGFIGLNGNLNHAIMIRSFLSMKGKLTYQAGAGIVIGSKPQGELNEVNSKISALRKAIELAEKSF